MTVVTTKEEILLVKEKHLTILEDILGDFLRGCKHRRSNVERMITNSGLRGNGDTEIKTPKLDAEEEAAQELMNQVLTLKVNT